MQLALEKKERLSPSPCMHTASIWGEGKFCLDREFSENAPYMQKKSYIIKQVMIKCHNFLLWRWISGTRQENDICWLRFFKNKAFLFQKQLGANVRKKPMCNVPYPTEWASIESLPRKQKWIFLTVSESSSLLFFLGLILINRSAEEKKGCHRRRG